MTIKTDDGRLLDEVAIVDKEGDVTLEFAEEI